MSTQVCLPKLGVSMTEATLVEWVVTDGDAVSEGDVICHIETDKVDQEVEAPASGTISLKGEEGDVYQVGDLLAEIA
ncbi:MAG TPA: lipoyl domain-containing protein [Acidimicrobiales bacterium]|jgi:2-oxoglutarate dehydrogenase E2 component (dihydrolipoamide succinyltransferase)